MHFLLYQARPQCNAQMCCHNSFRKGFKPRGARIPADPAQFLSQPFSFVGTRYAPVALAQLAFFLESGRYRSHKKQLLDQPSVEQTLTLPSCKVHRRVDDFGIWLPLKFRHIIWTSRDAQSAAYTPLTIHNRRPIFFRDRMHLASFYACSTR